MHGPVYGVTIRYRGLSAGPTHLTERAMKKNRIAELLSIRYPIFQAPMGRTAPPQLAAAVTNAGGVGSFWPFSASTPAIL